MSTTIDIHISPAMRKCIDHCTECHQVCLETITHCLHQGGEHVTAEHIRLMQDCVQICATSSDFMLRGSAMHRCLSRLRRHLFRMRQ